jgi:hypothetical protein
MSSASPSVDGTGAAPAVTALRRLPARRDGASLAIAASSGPHLGRDRLHVDGTPAARSASLHVGPIDATTMPAERAAQRGFDALFPRHLQHVLDLAAVVNTSTSVSRSAIRRTAARSGAVSTGRSQA